MSKIKVSIEFLPSDKGNIDYSQLSMPTPHEISNPTALNTVHAGGIRPFIVGVSKLGTKEQGGDGHVFWGKNDEWKDGRQVGGKVNWFMSEQLTNSDGTLTPPLEFRVEGTDIDHFTVYFDNITKEWATLINVDGKDYINDDAMFVWSGTTSNVHTIQIKKYSKLGFPVRVLGIAVGLTLDCDRNSIKSAKAANRNTFDNTKPSTGVATLHGNMELVDTDDNLLELSQLGLLKSDLPVKIYYNNILINSSITDEFKYSFGSTVISASVKDPLLNWSNTFFDGTGNITTNTALSFLNKLIESTPDIVNVSSDTISYLQKVSIPDGILLQGTLRNAWDTFCEATDLKIYKKTSGDIWLK